MFFLFRTGFAGILFFLSFCAQGQVYNSYISCDKVNDSIYEFPFKYTWNNNFGGCYTTKTSWDLSMYINDPVSNKSVKVKTVEWQLDTSSLFPSNCGIPYNYLLSGTGKINLKDTIYSNYKSLDSFLVCVRMAPGHGFPELSLFVVSALISEGQFEEDFATTICKVYLKNYNDISSNKGLRWNSNNSLSGLSDVIYKSSNISLGEPQNRVQYHHSEAIEILYQATQDDTNTLFFNQSKWARFYNKDRPTELYCPSFGACKPNAKYYYPSEMAFDTMVGDYYLAVDDDKPSTRFLTYFPVYTGAREYAKVKGKEVILNQTYLSSWHSHNNTKYGPSYPSQASRVYLDKSRYEVCFGDTLVIPFTTSKATNYSSQIDIKHDLSWDSEMPNAKFVITDSLNFIKKGYIQWVPTINDVRPAAFKSVIYNRTDTLLRTLGGKTYFQQSHLNNYTIQVKVHARPSYDVSIDSIRCNSIFMSLTDSIKIPGLWNTTWFINELGGQNELAQVLGPMAKFEVGKSGAYQLGVYSSNRDVRCGLFDLDTVEVPPFIRTDKLRDTILCSNQSITLDPNTQDSTGVVEYFWDNTRSITTTKTYKVQPQDTTIIFRIKNQFCDFIDSIHIKRFEPEVDFLPEDTMMCTGDKITILNDMENVIFREWFNDSVGEEVSVIAPETVWLDIRDSNQCWYRDTMIVDALAVPSFDTETFGSECAGDSLEIVYLNQSEPLIKSIFWETKNNTFQGKRFKIKPVKDFVVKLKVIKDTAHLNCKSERIILYPINQPTPIKIMTSDTLCVNQLPFKLKVDGATNGKLAWRNDIDNIDFSGEATTQFFNADTLWVTYTDSNNCISYDTASVVVEFIDSVILTDVIPSNICIPNEQIFLNDKSKYGNQIEWKVNNENLPIGAKYYEPKDSGTFHFYAKTSTVAHCKEYQNFGFAIAFNRPIATFDIGPNKGCEPLEVRFISNDSSYSSLWSIDHNVTWENVGSMSKTFSAGVYRIKMVAESKFCKDSSYGNIEVFPKPIGAIEKSLDTVYDNYPEVVFSFKPENSNYKYNWTSSEGDFSELNPWKKFFSFIGTNYVEVEVVNQYGCNLKLKDSLVLRQKTFILIPEAFSPNGNDLNDYFKPVDISGTISWEMSIFNRWGELVYRGDETSEGWDGQANGKPAMLGMYLYVIKTTNRYGEKNEYYNYVHLLR